MDNSQDKQREREEVGSGETEDEKGAGKRRRLNVAKTEILKPEKFSQPPVFYCHYPVCRYTLKFYF